MRLISASVRALALLLFITVAGPCLASEGGSSFQDSVASGLAVFIIVVLPIGGVVLFWLVHILPEKAAEKRHHPQKDAIQVLCLLSLVFGGLLWPLAWLWAYTKPVLHKAAYGTDKHEDYHKELEAKKAEAETATLAETRGLREELGQLRQELEELERRGELPNTVRMIRERLTRLEHRAAQDEVAGGAG